MMAVSGGVYPMEHAMGQYSGKCNVPLIEAFCIKLPGLFPSHKSRRFAIGGYPPLSHSSTMDKPLQHELE